MRIRPRMGGRGSGLLGKIHDLLSQVRSHVSPLGTRGEGRSQFQSEGRVIDIVNGDELGLSWKVDGGNSTKEPGRSVSHLLLPPAPKGQQYPSVLLPRPLHRGAEHDVGPGRHESVEELVLGHHGDADRVGGRAGAAGEPVPARAAVRCRPYAVPVVCTGRRAQCSVAVEVCLRGGGQGGGWERSHREGRSVKGQMCVDESQGIEGAFSRPRLQEGAEPHRP